MSSDTFNKQVTSDTFNKELPKGQMCNYCKKKPAIKSQKLIRYGPDVSKWSTYFQYTCRECWEKIKDYAY